MDVSDHAERVLAHLAAAKGSYLFGRRGNWTPMTLMDGAAKAEKRLVPDSLLLVDRGLVEQLVAAGYLDDNTGSNESLNMSFRISEKGRRLVRGRPGLYSNKYSAVPGSGASATPPSETPTGSSCNWRT
jgi:hypothetical protein